MKYLVTGTGRSGTGWAAKVLNDHGVKCGHQHVVTGHGVDWGERENWEAESSFWATPYLDGWETGLGQFTIASHRTALVVRNPVDCISSWLATTAFDQGLLHGGYGHRYKAMAKVCPAALDTTDPVRRVERYWRDWNRYAAERVDAVVRLEDENAAAKLLEGLDIHPETVVDPGPQNTAERVSAIPGDWEWDDATVRFAWELGYVL